MHLSDGLSVPSAFLSTPNVRLLNRIACSCPYRWRVCFFWQSYYRWSFPQEQPFSWRQVSSSAAASLRAPASGQLHNGLQNPWSLPKESQRTQPPGSYPIPSTRTDSSFAPHIHSKLCRRPCTPAFLP